MARDISLFEQQGCLSPHHIFIEDADGAQARDFAKALAEALTLLAATLPPARLSFDTAAAIRRMRERARWRGIGGQAVEIFEGADMAWTVVFDPTGAFHPIAWLSNRDGFCRFPIATISHLRLAPVAGRLEAFALAAPPSARARFLDVLAGAGVTYVCDPGQMQSPPLNWPHGGGAVSRFPRGNRDE